MSTTLMPRARVPAIALRHTQRRRSDATRASGVPWIRMKRTRVGAEFVMKNLAKDVAATKRQETAEHQPVVELTETKFRWNASDTPEVSRLVSSDTRMKSGERVGSR